MWWSSFVTTVRECVHESGRATEEYSDVVASTVRETNVVDVAAAAVKTVGYAGFLLVTVPPVALFCCVCLSGSKPENNNWRAPQPLFGNRVIS